MEATRSAADTVEDEKRKKNVEEAGEEEEVLFFRFLNCAECVPGEWFLIL